MDTELHYGELKCPVAGEFRRAACANRAKQFAASDLKRIGRVNPVVKGLRLPEPQVRDHRLRKDEEVTFSGLKSRTK